MSATAKNYAIAAAPKRIRLLGDKTVKPEPAEHIIEFPGGAIEVSRTSCGAYWAHIIVNQADAFADGGTRESARGIVEASRVDGGDGVRDVPGMATATQVAVLIRPLGVQAPVIAEAAEQPSLALGGAA